MIPNLLSMKQEAVQSFMSRTIICSHIVERNSQTSEQCQPQSVLCTKLIVKPPKNDHNTSNWYLQPCGYQRQKPSCFRIQDL